MVFSRTTLLKALNFGLIFTNDIAVKIQRECKGLAAVEPVCEYVANIAAIALSAPLPAANITETIPAAVPTMTDAAQALSAGGEPMLADKPSDKRSWWPPKADTWDYLCLIAPLLVKFLPAWLPPANNDNNGQQGDDRIAEAIQRELAPLRALVAGQERMIADLRAELNRAHDGAEVDGAPEDPAQVGLPGEATSIAEPDGDNSIHTAGEGESEAFGVANSGPGPDDEPEQAEGSSAEGGSEDGRPKRRTHRSKAGRANRHLRRAREREEEAERAEAEREPSFAALFEDAVGTPRVRLPGAA